MQSFYFSLDLEQYPPAGKEPCLIAAAAPAIINLLFCFLPLLEFLRAALPLAFFLLKEAALEAAGVLVVAAVVSSVVAASSVAASLAVAVPSSSSATLPELNSAEI